MNQPDKYCAKCEHASTRICKLRDKEMDVEFETGVHVSLFHTMIYTDDFFVVPVDCPWILEKTFNGTL